MTVSRPDPRWGNADDAELVAAVLEGRRSAFGALYDRHRLPLYRTALALTRRGQVAEELLQETFMRAFRHMGRIKLEPGRSLRPWLHRILINLVYDRTAMQRRRRQGWLARALDLRASHVLPSPERRAELRELEALVTEAISELPMKQRVVVVLFYLHDMELVEIAETIGVPEGTVKSRLYYGRSRLRALLERDSRTPEHHTAAVTTAAAEAKS